MKIKPACILTAAAVSCFAAALIIRWLCPGVMAVWPVIYALPGAAFMLLGIAFRKVKGVLLAGQIFFSLFFALALGELVFQAALKKGNFASNPQYMPMPGKRIYWDDDGPKTVVKKGKALPVLKGTEVFQPDSEILLFKPHVHGIHRSSCVLRGGKKKVAFEAEYTINGQGFRKVLCHTPAPPLPPLLFFGDSFTFGEGVDDDEAYVNRIAQRLKGKRNVYNFGIPGRDPTDFLYYVSRSYLEDSSLKGRLNARAFYLIINDHKYRVINNHEPYRLKYFPAQDKVVRKICYWMKERLFFRSALCEAVFNGIYKKRYIQYLKLAEKVLKEKYGTDLTVIVYPDCMPEMEKELREAGFELLELKKHMPGYKGYHARKIDLKYEIPYDGHPLPGTHALIADAVLEYLAGAPGRSSGN